MKKILLTLLSFLAIYPMIFAGGIVTNSNQSAAWVRSLARDASVDVDAVFYNPAGLTRLEDGFYIQVNNQTVNQTRTITSTYPTLNNGTYEGKTFVPVLPTVFAAYKFGKFAVSGGFSVIGGGGSAEFDRGLPEFEYQISGLPDALTTVGQKAGYDLTVNKYEMEQYFNGTSAYYGFQGAVSYALNDNVSIALGARYVTAKNTYNGYLKNINFVTPNGTVKGVDFMAGANPVILGVASQLTGVTQIPALLNPYLGAYGGATLTEAKALLDQIDPSYYASLVAAGQLVGLTDPNTVTLQQLNDGIVGATPSLNEQIAQLNTLANADLGDKELDVEQSGSGFAPFFGLDLSLLNGNLGIALKYEMKTNMNVTTTVNKDNTGTGLFVNNEEVPANLPALLTLGLRYKLSGLKLQAGFHYYFDEAAKYGKKNADGEFVTNGEETTFSNSSDTKLLSNNSWEFAIGAQYDITKLFGLSAGYLKAQTYPNSAYQSALSYSQPTSTFGFGAVVHPTSKFDIELGVSFTSYDDYTKEFSGYSETYDKTATIIALGLSYKL
ncbi:MAG: hypothetical protein R2771_14910 [Saprospiraceae bacterium]